MWLTIQRRQRPADNRHATTIGVDCRRGAATAASSLFIALFNVAVLNGVVMVATVVIGGLITSTLLTLLILPTLYGRFELESVGSAD